MKYFIFQTSQREKFSLRAKFKLKPEKMLYAMFEFATYIFVSLPIDKVQNLHPRRGKLKRTRNILRDFFKAIKGTFSMVYRKD